jgi:hypothetical protein
MTPEIGTGTHDVIEDTEAGFLPVCTRYSHVTISVLPGLASCEYRTPIRRELRRRIMLCAPVATLTKDDDIGFRQIGRGVPSSLTVFRPKFNRGVCGESLASFGEEKVLIVIANELGPELVVFVSVASQYSRKIGGDSSTPLIMTIMPLNSLDSHSMLMNRGSNLCSLASRILRSGQLESDSKSKSDSASSEG